MRKAIVILLFAIVHGNAAAEWVNIGSAGTSTVYIDPGSIRREKAIVELRYLVDFRVVQTMAGISFSSTTTRAEYDCNMERSRRLSFSFHSGNMGEGDVVLADSVVGQWAANPRGPLGERLRGAVCGKP